MSNSINLWILLIKNIVGWWQLTLFEMWADFQPIYWQFCIDIGKVSKKNFKTFSNLSQKSFKVRKSIETSVSLFKFRSFTSIHPHKKNPAHFVNNPHFSSANASNLQIANLNSLTTSEKQNYTEGVDKLLLHVVYSFQLLICHQINKIYS